MMYSRGSRVKQGGAFLFGLRIGGQQTPVMQSKIQDQFVWAAGKNIISEARNAAEVF